MSVNASMTHDGVAEPLRVLWTGKSGRRYVLTSVIGEGFAFVAGHLYILAESGMVRWVGVAEDLIADQSSRARFRSALADGATVMSLPAPGDDLARMTLAWDLEGTRSHKGRSAA